MTPLYFYRPRPQRLPYVGVPIAPFAVLVFVSFTASILVGGLVALGVAAAVVALGTGVLYLLTEYDDRALPHIARRLYCRLYHLDRTRSHWRASAYAPVVQGPRWARRRRLV